MDKITRKTSFGQWFSPINLDLFDEQVKTLKLDFYTKKLTTESFLKLLLYAQIEEVESLHALSDCLFDDQLQKGIDLDSISISQLLRRLNGMNPDLILCQEKGHIELRFSFSPTALRLLATRSS